MNRSRRAGIGDEEGKVTAKALSGTALCLSVSLLGACAPKHQRVNVTTLPRGAEVFLQRSGEVEVQASALGFHASFDAASFDESFFSLGTTPVDYEFRLEDREAAVAGGPAAGDVTRRYTEGKIRVVMDGYRTVERTVRFSGDRIDLELDMQPADPE
jgi:hypothetical protein